MKNIEKLQPAADRATNLEALELKANLNPRQREYLEVLKDKLKKVLGNKTTEQLAKENDLESLKMYKEVLDEILEFLQTKEMKLSEEEKFQEKALDYIEKLISEGADKAYTCTSLAGLDSDRAWKIRNEIVSNMKDSKRVRNLQYVVEGLAGLDSERAWKMREDYLKITKDKSDMAEGLTGLDSARAWDMREKLFRKGYFSTELSRLLGLSHVARSLAGLDSDRAWKMREKIKEQNIDLNNDAVADSLAGLDSERAWKMREDLLAVKTRLSSIVLSLSGLDSERAWEWREDLIKRLVQAGQGINEVTMSLMGVDSERAWQMREGLLKQGADKGYVVAGLAGLDSERAWKMREDLKPEIGITTMPDGVYGDWRMAGIRKARADKLKI